MKDAIFIMVDKDFNGSDVLTKKLQEGYRITSSISVNGQGWYVVEREEKKYWVRSTKVADEKQLKAYTL